MKSLGLALLALALLPLSILANAYSAISETVNGKPDDVDDDGVIGRSWEWGLSNWLGLSGPAVRRVLHQLWHEKGKRLHNLRWLTKAWIEEYPKRASKLGSLIYVLTVGILLWCPWRYLGG